MTGNVLVFFTSTCFDFYWSSWWNTKCWKGDTKWINFEVHFYFWYWN